MLLVAPACQRREAAAAPAKHLLGMSFGADPIRSPRGGQIPRRAFRRFVAHEMAGPWLRFLALDRALQGELDVLGIGPDRTLLGEMRRLVAGGLLADWLPAANGPWRSGKAPLDLSWCLARLWLRRGAPATWPAADALERTFLAEIDARAPRLVSDERGAAVCGDAWVSEDEVYPDLSALLTPLERDELLLRAIATAEARVPRRAAQPPRSQSR